MFAVYFIFRRWSKAYYLPLRGIMFEFIIEFELLLFVPLRTLLLFDPDILLLFEELILPGVVFVTFAGIDGLAFVPELVT